MIRQYNLLISQRAFFHRQYRFVEPVITSGQVTPECQCYADQLNSKLGQDTRLDPAIEIPKKIPAYRKHVLLISPPDRSVADPEWKSSWQSKLESNDKWPYSVIGTLKEHLKHSNAGSGVLVNAVSMVSGEIPQPKPNDDKTASIFVLPDMKLYKVAKNELEEFAHFLGGGVSDESRNKQLNFYNFLKGADNASVNTKQNNYNTSKQAKTNFDYEVFKKDWLLVCGHFQRDPRCGLIAEDLIQEIREKRLCVDKNIAITSHIGGHKYAGNLIIYTTENPVDKARSAVDCLWFSKVLPPNLPSLLENLEGGRIPKGLFRGGMSMN